MPSKGENPSLGGNLIIEGDNQLAFKDLLPPHARHSKCNSQRRRPPLAALACANLGKRALKSLRKTHPRHYRRLLSYHRSALR